MELEEFLNQLNPEGNWRLHFNNRSEPNLIRDKLGRCPIEHVAKAEYGDKVSWAASKLGLSESITNDIVSASDNSPNASFLRRRILKKCGLTKKGN